MEKHNKLRNKKHVIIFIDKPGIEEILFNTIKAIYDKSISSGVLNGENLEAFLLRSGSDENVHSHHCYTM